MLKGKSIILRVAYRARVAAVLLAMVGERTLTRVVLLVAVLTTLAGLGCDDSPMRPSEIVGVTWRLTAVELPGSPPIVVQDPSRYTLRFEDDGTLDIQFDCNQCSAEYVLDGNDLDVDTIACTLIGCGIDSLDPKYLAALEAAVTISLTDDGDDMAISGNGITLRFEQ
jgi:heat shock protein HslJ